MQLFADGQHCFVVHTYILTLKPCRARRVHAGPGCRAGGVGRACCPQLVNWQNSRESQIFTLEWKLFWHSSNKYDTKANNNKKWYISHKIPINTHIKLAAAKIWLAVKWGSCGPFSWGGKKPHPPYKHKRDDTVCWFPFDWKPVSLSWS